MPFNDLLLILFVSTIKRILCYGALATSESWFPLIMAAKSYLKQARDLITKKDFQGASKAAIQALDHDPGNYNA